MPEEGFVLHEREWCMAKLAYYTMSIFNYFEFHLLICLLIHFLTQLLTSLLE